MTKKSQQPVPKRQARGDAPARTGTRWVAIAGVVAVALAALGGGYWWYGPSEPARDGAPNWFPDGRALVFASEVGVERADIFRMNTDGSGRRNLTETSANDSTPSVSPSGELIAFESDRDGNDEIYVMAADGTNVRRLTQDPARDLAPAWSPDGRRIVFTSDRDSRASADVYIMNADGTGVERLTSDQSHWAPQFSPDGTQIALQVNLDVHVYDLAARTMRRLTQEPQNGMGPTWSPDGARLAFVSTRNRRAEIFTMNADGSNQRALVTLPRGNAIDPRWSPDGSRIAFVFVPDPTPANAPESDDAETQAIYLVDVATGTLERLAR